MEDLYGDPLSVWSRWADDLRGQRIESGHHMAEDAPEALAGALQEFLDPSAGQPDRGHQSRA